jgi:hypothetical protein
MGTLINTWTAGDYLGNTRLDLKLIVNYQDKFHMSKKFRCYRRRNCKYLEEKCKFLSNWKMKTIKKNSKTNDTSKNLFRQKCK